MTIFFMIMNLILTIIALLAIIILFLRQGKLFKLEDNQKKTIQEMEELLSSFVLEMKEDNEHLIKRMEEIKNEKSIFKHKDQKHLLPIELPINEKIEKEGKKKYEDLSSRLGKTVGNYAVQAYQQQSKKEKEEIQNPMKESNPSIEQKNPSLIQRDFLEDQIEDLNTQGYSIEEIAKRLKKGKTEIDLLLKFQESRKE
jgi:hypothetical protein